MSITYFIMINRKYAIMLLMASALAVGSVVFLKKKYVKFEQKKYVMRVEYKNFIKQSIAQTDTTPGCLLSSEYAEVTPEIDGKIEQIFVTPGQNVKKGDILIKLKSNKLERHVESSKASMKLAEYTYNKNSQLLKTNSIAQKAYQESKNKYEQALADYKKAEEELAQTNVRAPFDGIVNSFKLSIGMHMSAAKHSSDKSKCITITGPKVNRVDFKVLDTHVKYLAVGKKVSVETTSGKSFMATITHINPFVSKTLDVSVSARIDDTDQSDLLSGGYAKITYSVSDVYNAFIVPENSLYNLNNNDSDESKNSYHDQYGIFIKMDDDILSLIPVKLVLRDVNGISGMVAIVVPDEVQRYKNAKMLSIIINTKDAVRKHGFIIKYRMDHKDQYSQEDLEKQKLNEEQDIIYEYDLVMVEE